MGKTLVKLASRSLDSKPVFSSRFVVEEAEKFHLHYRNLRILLSMNDFKSIGNGCLNAVQRWKSLGSPIPEDGKHIELCRHRIAESPHDEGIKINLNKNLYNANKGKIFADGAELTDEKYIHLKIRDLRIELSIEDFKILIGAVKEAEITLNEVEKTEGNPNG